MPKRILRKIQEYVLNQKETRTLLVPNDLKQILQEVGVAKGQTILAHTLSSPGYLCGGAHTVIEELIDAVGEDGTIVMSAQSWKNLDLTDGV